MFPVRAWAIAGAANFLLAHRSCPRVGCSVHVLGCEHRLVVSTDSTDILLANFGFWSSLG